MTPDPPLPQESPQGDGTPCIDPSEAATAAPCAPGALSLATPGNAPVEDEAGEVVLGYCAAVRGILNDSQGGPLRPPGLRMREALQDVRDSLDRNLQAQKGELHKLLLNRLAGCIDRGLDVSRDALEQVGRYAQDLQAVDATLRPERYGDSGGASGAVPLVAGGVAGEHGSHPAALRQDDAQL